VTDQPKWTPGPWVLNIRASMGGATGEIVAEIEPPNSARDYRGDITRLQSCCHIGGIGHEELTANAKLIAAAPDLYAALEMAQLWLSVDGRFDMQGINAALAKARGETK